MNFVQGVDNQRRTKVETLKVIEFIPYKDFKEKLKLTKKYDGKAKVEIIDDKYIYIYMWKGNLR